MSRPAKRASGTSLRVALAVTLALGALALVLGTLQKAPCIEGTLRQNDAQPSMPASCYSDIPLFYLYRGLAQGIIPYQPRADLPAPERPRTPEEARSLSVEYPVLTGAWMEATSLVTHAVGKAPALTAMHPWQVHRLPAVRHDAVIFWLVNGIGFLILLIAGLALLIRAQPGRPWDALLVAASPALALSAMINWDLLPFFFSVAAIWAWSKRRPGLAGVFIGLGTAAKLYPLFFLGPLLVMCLRRRKWRAALHLTLGAAVTWLAVDLPVYLWSSQQFLYFWHDNAQRGADLGSVWLLLQPLWRTSVGSINLLSWLLFAVACLAVAMLCLRAERRPRVAQALFLVIAAFLFVNKVYSPQYVIWVLPLAALARPRLRDLVIWQACELFYFFSVWLYVGQANASGGIDGLYRASILVHMCGLGYLCALTIRDILRPSKDPVRADGVTDDPIGGVLLEPLDSAPDAEGPDAKPTRRPSTLPATASAGG